MSGREKDSSLTLTSAMFAESAFIFVGMMMMYLFLVGKGAPMHAWEIIIVPAVGFFLLYMFNFIISIESAMTECETFNARKSITIAFLPSLAFVFMFFAVYFLPFIKHPFLRLFGSYGIMESGEIHPVGDSIAKCIYLMCITWPGAAHVYLGSKGGECDLTEEQIKEMEKNLGEAPQETCENPNA